MFSFLPTIILRHRKENLRKCTLQPLRHREDLSFFSYPKGTLPPLKNYLLLTIDAPPLTIEDQDSGLLLLDGTWLLAKKMEQSLPPNIEKRSLPSSLRTAYPRRQTECEDPTRGLASIEALYASHKLLQRDTRGLLDDYHWKDAFLELNNF